MIRKSAVIFIITGVVVLKSSFSKLVLPNLAFGGGPSAGWYFNNTSDLNAELKKAGFPELSTNGFFTLGGAGFLDIELKKRTNAFLRFGGFGVGFSTHKDQSVNDTLAKAVT